MNQEQSKQRTKKGALNPLLGVAVGMVATVAVVGAGPRIARQAELNHVHQQLVSAVPQVNAITIKPADEKQSLTLPGDIQPIQNIPIYARANGYIRQRFVDIGDIVKKGDLLAIIDTPELDQQVEQAAATLRQAQANLTSALSDRENFAALLFASDAAIKQNRTNLEYSTVELKRYQKLAAEGALSYEQRDQALKQFNSDTAGIQISEENRRAQLAQVASANARIAADRQAIKVAQSGLDQLKALQNFQKVVAPSDGVITDRFVDAGALVAAGGATGTTELLSMAKTDVLRIYVNVPQSDYRYIHNGDKADILLQEFPGKAFLGRVSNIAGSLDSNSRTLQTEIRIDNRNHQLKPGSYADVRFVFNNIDPPEVIPSNAAVTKDDGLYAPVVRNGKLHFQRIEVSRDYGSKLEVSEGLKPNDVVVLDVPDGISEGSKVNPHVSHI